MFLIRNVLSLKDEGLTQMLQVSVHAALLAVWCGVVSVHAALLAVWCGAVWCGECARSPPRCVVWCGVVW